MTPSKKNKPFDAVAASRRWRARSSRELAGLTYEQLQARLARCANADSLLPSKKLRTWRKATAAGGVR
jgi:hypothetical protein